MRRKILDELEEVMLLTDRFISDVFELLDEDMTSTEMARHFGHDKPWNVEKHLHAIDMIYDPSLATNFGKQVHSYAKGAARDILMFDISPGLRKHLHQVIDTEPKLSDHSPKQPLPGNGILVDPREWLDEETVPGVYVYTYPQYLITELLSDDERTLFKVGASQATSRRLEQQRRQTEVPEDIEIIRVYPSDHCFEDEVHFHNILKRAGHHQKTTRAGTEWFRTSLPMIDAIADALGLSADR
ncbi:hypothetical protein GCM10009720_16150 [Yaniella flava]|uniref:Bacteriophage T5 Orf172 DNA-binding domain-containing protein n=1 Tax=Yaniella flava TaxID=287930 RepID=A0ABP5FXT6_9MICC|nr:GIY-YIG nuclease family protein [Micrococcaceae bacterium]